MRLGTGLGAPGFVASSVLVVLSVVLFGLGAKMLALDNGLVRHRG